MILDNLNFKGKISNISYSKGSADGGISNSIKVLELYFNYYGIQSDWISYENISKIKQSKFLNKYLTSLKKFNSLVHFHGLWRSHSRLRNLNDILYVVSPHGMLMPHCLKRSRIKKYIYSKIWEDNFIQNARYIFTLSIKEASTIPEKYKNKNIIVFPNSVLIPETQNNIEFIPPPWKDDIGHSKRFFYSCLDLIL